MMVRLLTFLLLATAARAEVISFKIPAPTTAGTIYAIGNATGATPDVASEVWGPPDTTIDHLTCGSSAAPGGGNSWTIGGVTSPATSNTFTDQGFACPISGASTKKCADATTSITLGNLGSISFPITTVGSPAGGSTLWCSFRVSGAFQMHLEAILVPTTGSATAYGSFSVNSAGDYQAMQPVIGAGSSSSTGFICILNHPIPSGSLNIRVRRGTGPTFTWANTPINDTITGAGVFAALDNVNTQSWNNVDAASFLLSVTGTIPANTVARCGLPWTK